MRPLNAVSSSLAMICSLLSPPPLSSVDTAEKVSSMLGASLVSRTGIASPSASTPRRTEPLEVMEMKSSPSGVVNLIWNWASVPSRNCFSSFISTAAT